MSLSTGKWSRTITIAGFVADSSPNTSAPSEALVFKPNNYLPNNAPTQGHMLLCAYNVETEAGIVSFTTWFRDETDRKWYKLTPDTISHRDQKIQKDLRDADVFFQVTGITVTAAATTVTLKATEV